MFKLAVMLGAIGLASLAAIAQSRPAAPAKSSVVEIRRTLPSEEADAAAGTAYAKSEDVAAPEAPPPPAPPERKVRVIVPSPFASGLD